MVGPAGRATLAPSSSGAPVYRSFLALRYVRTRFVNLISIGGVMAGVAVLIVVTSVMDGFQERVRAVLRGNLSHLVVLPQGEELPELTALVEQVRGADARIVGVAPQVTVPVGFFYDDGPCSQVRWNDRSLFLMTAVGVDWDQEKRIEAALEARQGARARDGTLRLLAAGNLADPFDSAKARAVERVPVLVSRAFLRTFRGLSRDEQLPYALDMDLGIELLLQEADASGQVTVRHQGRSLVVSGVYDGGDQSEDRSRLILRRADLVSMARLRAPYEALRVWIGDYARAPEVKASLLARVPGVSVQTWEEQREDFLRAVKTEKVLLVIVLSFIVLLGGFIILATLTLTVVEKTRDIGVLAALGASRAGILSIFLRNGLFIGVLGSLLGLGLGGLFVVNINGVKRFFESIGIQLFPPDIYLFTEIPTVWSWVSVVTIMGGSVLVAFLAGLVPALRAARLDPIVALRHE